MVTSSSDQARGWSASATAPATAPVATPERKRCCCSQRPDLADQRDELGHRGQERPGRHGATELLDDDGRLEEGQPDAAELLGDGEGGPVEGDHGSPQLLGGLTGLDDGPHHVDGALLLEEGTHRVTQLFLLSRELELHCTPSPAVPVASPTLPAAPVGGRRSGRVYLTPMSASAPVLASRRPVFWEGRGLGVPRGVAGPRRKPGPAARGVCGTVLADTGGRSPTLCGAPLAQRQSNGLLIRRFRVRIPRGASRGLHSLSLTPIGRQALEELGRARPGSGGRSVDEYAQSHILGHAEVPLGIPRGSVPKWRVRLSGATHQEARAGGCVAGHRRGDARDPAPATPDRLHGPRSRQYLRARG